MSRKGARSVVFGGVQGVVVTTLCLLVGGCAREPAPSEANGTAQVGSDSWTTSTFDVNCRGCHSKGAEGAAVPLMDSEYWMVMDNARAIAAIGNGQGKSMPAYLQSRGGVLTDEQLPMLVAGMRRLWGGAARNGPVSQGISSSIVAGDPLRGKAVFDASCAQCHGEGASGGSVTDPMYLRMVSDQAIWTSVVVGRAALGMPSWNQAMKGHPNGLTAAQVADVVAWIVAQRPSGGAG